MTLVITSDASKIIEKNDGFTKEVYQPFRKGFYSNLGGQQDIELSASVHRYQNQ